MCMYKCVSRLQACVLVIVSRYREYGGCCFEEQVFMGGAPPLCVVQSCCLRAAWQVTTVGGTEWY